MPGGQETFQSYGYGWANASNTPFRLFKQFDHEGGTRSPLIISWPRGIASELSGQLVGEVCHVIDIFPTLLDLVGAEIVEQQPIPMEGRSLAPALQGKDVKPHEALFWAHNKGSAVWSAGWKLVSPNRGQQWELYHLPSDGTELHDLSLRQPAKARELQQLHKDWLARNKAAARSGIK